jgi:hypothetical protein
MEQPILPNLPLSSYSTFNLEDFIPYYVDVNSSSNVYPNLSNTPPETFYQSINMKQEFSSLKLSATQETPSEDIPFLNHQEFVARFLSPKTPYNRLLAFHAVGTGKCVHPSTIVSLSSSVSIFSSISTISHLWEVLRGGMIIEDDEQGEWTTPKETINVLSYNSFTNQIESKKVLRLYRQKVNTLLYHYNSGGHDIICTEVHKLYTPNGFQCKLEKETPVLHYYNNTTQYYPIQNVRTILYNGYVYDLEVEDNHTYIANGFITHNTCLLTAVGEKAKELNPSISKIIVLTKHTLIPNVVNDIAGICTKGKYMPSKELLAKKSEEGGKEMIYKVIKDSVKSTFDILTLTNFCNTPEIENNIKVKSDGRIEANDEDLHEAFDGSYIIIDEAHNIIPTKSDKQRTEQYYILHYLVHTVKGLKLLLLTATPMKNDPHNIVPLLNLLLPIESQIRENILSFSKKWFDDNNKLKNPENFISKYLIGNTSYLRSSISDIEVKYMGDILPERKIFHTKLVSITMHPHQAKICYEKLMEEKSKRKLSADELDTYSLAFASRHSSSFVFPDESILKAGEIKWINIEKDETSSQSKIRSFSCNNTFRSYLRANGSDRENMLQQVKKCSVKFEYIIRTILENPKEKIFIYSNIIQGGGCLLLGSLLKEFGFSDSPKYTKDIGGLTKEKRFAIFATELPSKLDIVSKIINNPKNIYGDYIQVIIGGEQISEGISFYHIRQMLVLTPEWNMASLDQAIGRSVRTFGHQGLLPSEKNIKIHRLCASFSSDSLSENAPYINYSSIDEHMYQVSEDKDVKIKQIEHLIKQVAVDCSLNKERNQLSTDIPNSRECDYGDCDYTCYAEELNNESTPISDTYNLFYGEKETNGIIKVIKQLYKKKFSYDFYELLTEIRKYSISETYLKNLSSILLARSLYKIIVNNIVIINRFGFFNYLREDQNLYFLSDDPSGSNVHTLGWYSSHPFPDKILNYEEAIITYYNKHYPKIIKLLNQNVNNIEIIKNIISNSPVIISEKILEETILMYEKLSFKQATPLVEVLYQIYSKYIIRHNFTLLHNIFGNPRMLIFKEGIHENEQDQYEWITISSEDFEERKKKGEQKKEFIIDSELFNQVGIEGYIPFDYVATDKYRKLKIRRKILERTLATGGVDKRYVRGGNNCNTHSNYSKKGCIALMVELIRFSQKYHLIMPFDNYKNKVEDLESEEEFSKNIRYAIEKWDMYHQIANKLVETNQAFPVLYSLKKNIVDKTNVQILCNKIGLTDEQCLENEIPISTKIFTVQEVVDLLKFYTESIPVLYSLFREVMGRDYLYNDFMKQLDPDIIEVMSKAIHPDVKGKELCNALGRWLELNNLLGMS